MVGLVAIDPTLNAAGLTIESAHADGYKVTATSASGNRFTATRNPDGTVDLSCTATGRAGCPATGVWG